MKPFIISLFLTIPFVNCISQQVLGGSEFEAILKDTANWNIVSIQKIDPKKHIVKYKFTSKNNKSNFDTLIYLTKHNKILERREFYKSKSRESVIEYYYKSGRIKKNYVQVNDTIIYESIYYGDKYNSIKFQFNYSNGELNGKSYQYYTSKGYECYGINKAEYNYNDGLLHGEIHFFRKNGVILEKRIYEKGYLLKTYFYNKKGILYSSLSPY